MPKLMRHTVAVSCAAAVMVLAGQGAVAQDRPLDVVPQVDFGRYAGTWYEVARLPNRFEEGCARDITATYTPRNDGRIDVVNRCVEKDGGVNEAKGIARRVDGRPPSVLKVSFAPSWLGFLPMVWGDYQIIELGADYGHAIVGSPDRKYLWFLAREPKLDQPLFERLKERARSQGFDVTALVLPPHTPR